MTFQSLCLCPFVLQLFAYKAGKRCKGLFHLLFQLSLAWPRQGKSSTLGRAFALPFNEGDDLFPCRRGAPGVSDSTDKSTPLGPPSLLKGRESRVPGLAVDGGTVWFSFPCRTDYPHEAVSKLLQDHPLRLRLRLVSELGLFGLLQQTLARGLQHLLCHKRVRKPGGKEYEALAGQHIIILHHHPHPEVATPAGPLNYSRVK